MSSIPEGMIVEGAPVRSGRGVPIWVVAGALGAALAILLVADIYRRIGNAAQPFAVVNVEELTNLYAQSSAGEGWATDELEERTETYLRMARIEARFFAETTGRSVVMGEAVLASGKEVRDITQVVHDRVAERMKEMRY